MTAKLRFALLGKPVRHSASPAMMAAAFDALGLPHTYTALEVGGEAALERIVGDIRRGNFAGANVTLPYKTAVLSMADAVDASAERAGAANVLARHVSGRVVAHNTDVPALVEEIGALVAPGERSCAVVLGAGGAGAAVVVALKELAFRVIGVTTRSWTSSQETFESTAGERLRALGALTSPWPLATPSLPPGGKSSQVLRLQWLELAKGADLLVQATSAGMHGGDPGDPLATIVPWDDLQKRAVAYDLVYRPAHTAFLAAAERRGLLATGGLGMLVRQAARSLALWLGVTPPVDVMRAAAELEIGVKP